MDIIVFNDNSEHIKHTIHISCENVFRASCILAAITIIKEQIAENVYNADTI